MKPFRSTLAALAVAGAAVGTGFFGFNYVQKTQFANAAEQVQLGRDQLAKADDLASVFRYVGKVVEPSVVNISVTKKMSGAAHPGGRMRNLPLDKDQLRRFFPDRDGDGQPDVPDLETPEESPELHGTGSGVIMEANDGIGYILTNNHVAGDASQFEITLSDGRKFTKASLVGADKKTDLAVVKIEADRLIPAKWGNSDDLQKGDWVMAFGSPFGYIGSMTHGIVSALNRTGVGILNRQGYENFIQVDAPINPGNSGGPLVNVRGEVVGINTAIASRTGTFSGIGFAIPANQAKFVYHALKSSGKVSRGWLGVSISDVSVDPQKAQSFGYKGNNGVLVEQVVANTPATGKLQPGDIILAIDGKPVETVQQLRNQIAATAPNTEVKLTVFRDGKEQPITLKLGEQPENVMASNTVPPTGNPKGMPEADAGKIGLRLANPNDELLKKWDLADIKSGAVVTAVERNSLAAKAGINPGDVITKVGPTDVKDAQSATEALAKVDAKKGVRLYVTTKDPESGQVMSRFVFVRGE
ncbi:MAG: degP 2 [Phycisphaerales bacterium]|jgi:serine protease Do|nr:degP 2 [Phycisphaerales bacterium]